MRDVCRRLGVSHNLVHERFGSKESLWYAAIEHGFSALAAELATAAQQAEGDELDRLRAVLIRYVEVTRASALHHHHPQGRRPGGRLDHVYDQYIRPAHEVADVALRSLAAKGRARPLSPAAALPRRARQAASSACPRWPGDFPGGQAPDADLTAVAREAVDVVLRGIVL